ncbi:hypothetical protein A9Y76_07035 [Ralstonia insidiosa]|uniref:Uncharacterized protein n=1 Tax=Ralstonia insidiosa TaxID=190721 RepID=A0A191ZVX2_9RALS|nr:hypothetical protein [Ralstonia insidiosa]ANJ72232.1 hypothetical protein A9Y76_07035 [Ralstonia insidiosa]
MSNDRKQEIADAIYELENALGCIEFHTEKIKATIKSLKEISEKADHEEISLDEDYLIWKAGSIGSRYIRNYGDGEEDLSVFHSLHDRHEDYLKEKKEAKQKIEN